jgi:formylglycine-generating enzyme required for sulfatase activity
MVLPNQGQDRQAMSSKVFISYRRDDARWPAKQIYDAFIKVLSKEDVFIDINSIPPGADFVKTIKDWVEQCDFMLVIIGSGWIDAVDSKSGKRRLENPKDFVRIEVREGLKRGIPVVPVIFDRAPIPKASQLPNDLKKLTLRNAEFIEHCTVDSDVERLIRRLNLTAASPPPKSPTPQSSVPTVEEGMRAEGRILVDAAFMENASGKWFKPGNGKTEWFKDHERGPEMVVVPVGNFTMGSLKNEPERKDNESPFRQVTIASPFAVGRHAVTRGQFAAFVKDTDHKIDKGARVYKGTEWHDDHNASWRCPRFTQDDGHPVVCINWDDANAYASWLTEVTGKIYRLLTEAEREYVTRAGTTTPFWWGSSIFPRQANYNCNYGYGVGSKKGKWKKATVSSGNFTANPWGLYNVHGNVWEWCEDDWHDTYDGAPTDLSAWLQNEVQGCRVLRGGSWISTPDELRAAFRFWFSAEFRYFNVGFRIGRTLSP